MLLIWVCSSCAPDLGVLLLRSQTPSRSPPGWSCFRTMGSFRRPPSTASTTRVRKCVHGWLGTHLQPIVNPLFPSGIPPRRIPEPLQFSPRTILSSSGARRTMTPCTANSRVREIRDPNRRIRAARTRLFRLQPTGFLPPSGYAPLEVVFWGVQPHTVVSAVCLASLIFATAPSRKPVKPPTKEA